MKKAKLSVSEEAEGKELHNRLIALRRLREQGKDANRRPRRFRLTTEERAAILRKTGGKCRICGGEISGRWHADHILAHSAGGMHAADNYLPAHVTCNNYRWDYLTEEFELILKGTFQKLLRNHIAALVGARNPHVLRVHSVFSAPSALLFVRSSHFLEVP